MKSYLCFVHVRPNSVPELRALVCDNEDQLPASLALALNEWPSMHQIEVIEGDRVVLAMTGADIAMVRRNSTVPGSGAS